MKRLLIGVILVTPILSFSQSNDEENRNRTLQFRVNAPQTETQNRLEIPEQELEQRLQDENLTQNMQERLLVKDHGGGSTSDILEISENSGNPLLGNIEDAAREQRRKEQQERMARDYAKQNRENREHSEVALERWETFTDLVVRYRRIFELLEFPFNQTQLESERLSRIYNGLTLETFHDTIQIARSEDGVYSYVYPEKLKIEDKEVTFISYPAQRKVTIAILSMASDLFARDDRRQTALFSTMYHEALVQEGLETTNDYTYSSEFNSALEIVRHDSTFRNWISSLDLFNSCTARRSTYRSLIRDARSIKRKFGSRFGDVGNHPAEDLNLEAIISKSQNCL